MLLWNIIQTGIRYFEATGSLDNFFWLLTCTMLRESYANATTMMGLLSLDVNRKNAQATV